MSSKEGHLPRTDYTFFPNPQERECLAAADPQSLAEIFLNQPEMLPQFLLELWRTNRQEDMFTALQVVGKDNLPVDLLLRKEMITSLALAHTMCGVTLDICKDFLRETFYLVEKVLAGKTIDSPIDPGCEGEIKNMVNQIEIKIVEAKQTYMSKTN